MKALTIKQPYAQLIVDGIKDIENRTWPTIRRGKVLIHVSQFKIKSETNFYNIVTPEQWNNLPGYMTDDIADDNFVRSAIIGEIEIVDCIKDSKSIWALPDHWHWIIANPVRYEQPILNVKGALSFWDYPKQLKS